MELTALKQRLKNNGGYILSDEIDEMIEEFGEGFKICVKYWEHPRQIMSLKDLKILESTENEYSEDIREVFITASVYEELFEADKK